MLLVLSVVTLFLVYNTNKEVEKIRRHELKNNYKNGKI
jgi:hypothetical protein